MKMQQDGKQQQQRQQPPNNPAIRAHMHLPYRQCMDDTTQFDPDEYWQTLEPAYCLVFGSANNDTRNNSTVEERNHQNGQENYSCALTWEWSRRWSPSPSSTTQSTASMHKGIIQNARLAIERALHGPVRSYVSILPTYCYYLACRYMFHWAENIEEGNDNSATNKTYAAIQRYSKHLVKQHATYIISKGPAFLNAILVAAPTDLSVWLIASRMDRAHSITATATVQHESCCWKSWQFWALMCSITSWFHGYALVRTYANSVETMCLMVGVALLGPELFDQSNHRGQHHRPQAKLAFVLGGLSACVRFTSLAAWIPLGLAITLRDWVGTSHESKKYRFSNVLHTLFGLCVTYGLIGTIFGCCIDRWFYGFWAIPFLGNIHFNVLLGHGSLYGTHPFLWYAYAGIPAICGIMLPFFLWEISTIDTNPRLTLLGIITPYIVLHSFSEHKEFRFLLPILPIICILAGHAMSRLVQMIDLTPNGSGFDSSGSMKSMKYKAPPKSLIINENFQKFLLVVLLISNYPHLLYLGLIHQRGAIAVNRYLVSAIDEETRQSIEYNENENIQQYSIHYLMGCHSSPLYSHLHTLNARANAWHLGCPPDCRSSPDIVCESDAFSSDPAGFVMSAYGIPGDDSCLEGEVVREPPSLLVVMQDDAVVIENLLSEKLKMDHIASIRHTIKSLSWHSQNYGDVSKSDWCPTCNRDHDVFTLFSLIDFHFDHMEVFAKIGSSTEP
eukprot:CAMPEP_0181099622 /NCGR_PEP_ID=MMETSP1071-20121207/12758_1 /TAXON_ID=35127 /ORGANISM="Thalassiosira sp., Strain NH16" /LENGTH=728 /DNA_ID=CAMNT_0023182297 /DNA_START=245 /DNA_END=2432 /DNA_ORIENTATION=-